MKTEILLLVLCGGEFGLDWQWKWCACDDVVKCENKPRWLDIKCHIYRITKQQRRWLRSSESDVQPQNIDTQWRIQISSEWRTIGFHSIRCSSTANRWRTFPWPCDLDLWTHNLQNLISSRPDCMKYWWKFGSNPFSGSWAIEFTRSLLPSLRDLDLWTHDLETVIRVTYSWSK